MKKTIIPVLLLFITFQTYAQDNRIGNYGFKLGLTANPTFGFGKIDEGKGNGVALGFSYGLIGDFNFSENYSFSTGLMITTINSKVTKLFNQSSLSSMFPQPAPSYIDLDYKYKMQYIEIPLTLKLKTANIQGVRWFGQFGLSNGIRLSAKGDFEMAGGTSQSNVNWSDRTSVYRAAMIIGGGGEFELSGNTNLLLGLTLNNGFTNLSSDSSEKIKNHYVGINLGVFF